jgi:hypothetical protein
MVLNSNGYGVAEQRLGCYRVTVVVSQSNGYGVIEVLRLPLRSSSLSLSVLRVCILVCVGASRFACVHKIFVTLMKSNDCCVREERL